MFPGGIQLKLTAQVLKPNSFIAWKVMDAAYSSISFKNVFKMNNAELNDALHRRF